MKQLCKYIPIIAGLAICFLVGTVLSLLAGNDDTTNKIVYIENPAELYDKAAKVLESGDLQLTVTVNTKITIDRTTYNESRKQVVRFDRSEPKDHRYCMQEELTMGTHRVVYENYYIDNNYYQVISGVPLQIVTNETLNKATISKVFPAPALDQTLYKQITGIHTDDGYQIEFSEATALEDWAGPQQALLKSASGTAILSNDEHLLSCSYTAAFTYNSILYEVTCQLTPEPNPTVVTLPDVSWIDVTAPEALLRLELAVGILVQANPIFATYQEDVYFEALGDRRGRIITLRLDDVAPLSGEIVTETTTTNDSRLDQSDKTIKTETFTDGKYTVLKNNGEVAIDPSIDADAMTAYLHNQLISTIMLPEYIANCTKEDNGATVRYNLTGNTAFAEFLCRNAGQQLYGDPELLTGETDSMETVHLTCFLELDRETGFPLASGIRYEGSYTAEGLPYRFTYEAAQTYQYKIS